MNENLEKLKLTIKELENENLDLKEKIKKLENLIFRLQNDIDFLSK